MRMLLKRPRSLILAVLPSLALVLLPAVHAAEAWAEPGDPAQGAKTWADNCVRCHMMRDPAEFRDDLWRPIMSHMRIRAGLTGTQTRDVLEFMRASNYTAPVAMKTAATAPAAAAGVDAVGVDAARGQAVYNQTCVACHGADGKGAIPGVPDLTATTGPLTKTDDVLLQHIIEGFKSPNAVMMMPARGGNPALTDAELEATLRYLRDAFSR